MQWMNIVNICLVSVWNWIQKIFSFCWSFIFQLFLFMLFMIYKRLFLVSNVSMCYNVGLWAYLQHMLPFSEIETSKNKLFWRDNYENFGFLKSGRKYHFSRISPEQIFSFKHKMTTKSPLSNAMVSVCLFMKFYFFRLNLSRELVNSLSAYESKA